MRPGKWIIVKVSENAQAWNRAQILNAYSTTTGSNTLERRVDVMLMDRGYKVMGVNYPENVGKLPEMFENVDPVSFVFKLDGIS